MKKFFKSFIGAFITIGVTSCSAQTDSNTSLNRVVIIRHAEKPDKGDNLSCKGLNRSLDLPAVLYNKYKLPAKIFVPSVGNGKTASQLRMLETITPFAVKYNIAIDSRFNVKDANSLAAAIKKTKGYALVVWEHDNINNIVKALGADDKGIKWSDDDFDSIWIIEFKNGKATLSADKENLSPSDVCK